MNNKNIKDFFKNKKVMLVGLGILGGSGLSSAKWLLKYVNHLTITDSKNEKDLLVTINKLKKYSSKITYVLGKHREEDFQKHDIIVVNPAIPILNQKFEIAQLIKKARENKKLIINDIGLLLKFTSNPLIGITGTRGKTTTTTWIGHLLKPLYPKVFVGGNIPDNPALNFFNRIDEKSPLVLELSCFQLELKLPRPPKIAMITNLYQDHLNRYQTMKRYARVKANIFSTQNNSDYLVLNYDNQWTKFFLSLKPKAKIYYISLKNLPLSKNGIFINNNKIYWQENKTRKELMPLNNFKLLWGEHNMENLLRAILVAKLMGVSLPLIKKQIKTLPHIKMRQEVIYHDKNLLIINDSAGTSPEATINLIKRFKDNKNFILITGGTDKQLDFSLLAETIKKYLKPQHLILLNGSGTQKLIQELRKRKFDDNFNIFENLETCLKKALENKKNKTIIAFSPGAASFEKFKNEFDRGEQFNLLVKQYLNKKPRH